LNLIRAILVVLLFPIWEWVTNDGVNSVPEWEFGNYGYFYVTLHHLIGKIMPRPEHEPLPYLSARGRKIFYKIVKHITENDLIQDIDVMELSMLANSFDTFEIAAAKCNVDGLINPVTGKNGTFDQVSPYYSIVKNEYGNIMKHSMQFGLSPGTRIKIFNGMKKKKKASPLEAFKIK